MGFFAEHALGHEFLAVLTGAPHFRVEFDADHQAFSANFPDFGIFERSQRVDEIPALIGGIFDHALFHQHPQGGAGNGAGQGIAAEGAAVFAGAQHIMTSLLDKTAETG